MQLPPVGSSPVWATNPRPVGLAIQGLSTWLSFNAAVELTEVIPMGPEQASFRETLLRDTEGVAAMADYNLRRTRMRDDGSVGTESAAVDSSIYSFPMNDAADTWHWERLKLLGTHIATSAHHTVAGLTAAPTDWFRGLYSHIFLDVGDSVFVNNKVWPAAGLANGAVAEVVHMQRTEVITMLSVPEATLASELSNVRTRPKLKGYFQQNIGPLRGGGGAVDFENVIPIAPNFSTDDRPSVAHNLSGTGVSTSTQLPLMLYFGIINHKSRVCSLNRAVLDIGNI